MLSLLYSSGRKRSERLWSSCPAVSLQPLLTTTEYFSRLNQSYSDASNHLHCTILLSRGNSFFKYYVTSTPSSITASTSTSTQLIVDLSMVTKVMVTGVKVGPHTTVKDFCDKVWDNINGKNNHYMRVDVVADNYETPYLLKNGVRVDRGSGTTVTFELESLFPSNFKTDFFFCCDNKARLYRIMAGYFATLARDSITGTQYFITQGSSEVSGALPDSTHLEADFRLVGHMLHAARNGCSRTIFRGNDTDICIILLAYLPTLLQCNSDYKLLFGVGKLSSLICTQVIRLQKKI